MEAAAYRANGRLNATQTGPHHRAATRADQPWQGAELALHGRSLPATSAEQQSCFPPGNCGHLRCRTASSTGGRKAKRRLRFQQARMRARTHASERASERVVFLAASRCCRREHSQPSLDSDEGAMLASHPLPPQWPHFFGQQASLSLLRIPPAAWHSFSGTSVLFPLVELPVGGCFSNATPKPSVSFSVLCPEPVLAKPSPFSLYIRTATESCRN